MIRPDWLPHASTRSAITTSVDGNLALHVNDDRTAVIRRRAQIESVLTAVEPIQYLSQVHGLAVRDLDHPAATDAHFDACLTRTPNRICAILTADCLPVLFAAHDGSVVGAAHAGWRGMLAGVLPATLIAMGSKAARTAALLGPCIGPMYFEVGADVRDAFLSVDPRFAPCFRDKAPNKWLADLPAMAVLQLNQFGLTDITATGLCTVENNHQFYSYRQENGSTGRFASLVWMQP